MPSASNYSALMGLNTAWGLATEATYGTAVAATFFIPFISESVKETTALFDVRHTQNRFTNKTNNRGRTSVAGDVQLYAEPETLGQLLFYMFGTEAANPTQVGTTLAYTHTFDVQDDVKSFSSEFKYGSDAGAKNVLGCVLTSLSFEFGEDLLTVTAGMNGKNIVDKTTAAAIAYPAGMHRPYTFRDMKMKLAASSSANHNNEASATDSYELNIVGGSVTITHEPYTEDFRMGTDLVGSMPAGYFSYEGSVDMVFKRGDTLVDAWLGGTETDVWLEWTGDRIVAATAGTERSLTLYMPNTSVMEKSPAITVGDRIMRTVSFKGFHDANNITGYSTVKNLRAQLTNKKNAKYA